MRNPVDRTAYRAPLHYARATSVDKRLALSHNRRVAQVEGFFMQLANSRPDRLRSINRGPSPSRGNGWGYPCLEASKPMNSRQ